MSHAINLAQRLPRTVSQKLRQILYQLALVTVARAVAIATSALLAAMLISMGIDWTLNLFEPLPRRLLCLASIGLAIGLLIHHLRPLKSILGREKAAKLADGAVPQLQERWLAITESSSRPRDHGPVYNAMLRQVTSEAIALSPMVDPKRTVDVKPLQKSTLFLVAWIAMAALVIGAWPRGRILAARFWSFGGDVSATRLTCVTKHLAVPSGESTRLEFRSVGVRPNSGRILMDFGERQVEAFDVLVEPPGQLVYPIASVDQSFRYRLQAGDDQTDWYSVTALERPKFKSVRVIVDAPEYTKRGRYERDHLPSRLKAIEGSRLTLELVPANPIEEMHVIATTSAADEDDSTVRSIPIVPAPDGVYRYSLGLWTNMVLEPGMISHDGLTPQETLQSRVQVIPDKPPVARLLSPTEGLEVSADQNIQIEFEAHDDHGLAKIELVVYDESNSDSGDPPVLHVEEILIDPAEMPRHVMSSIDLDLSQFRLDENSQLSFAIRVLDNREIAPEMIADVLPNGGQPDGNLASTDEPSPADGSRSESVANLADDSDGDDIADSRRIDDQPIASESPSMADPRIAQDTEAAEESSKASVPEDSPVGEPVVKGPNAVSSPVGQNPGQVEQNSSQIVKESLSERDFIEDSDLSDTLADDVDPKQRMSDVSHRQRTSSNSELTAMALPEGPVVEDSEHGDGMIRRRLDFDEARGAMSVRLRLKIIERVAMKEQAFDESKSEIAIRDDLDSIDEQLAAAQELLATVSQSYGEVSASPTDRAERLENTDASLRRAKALVAELRDRTLETPLTFVGLQMVNMGRVHIAPARDRVIQIRRTPVDAQSVVRLRVQTLNALGHVTQAREFLAGLMRKMEDISHDKQLAEDLEQIAKMYEVYVENHHRILRQSQANRNPLKRKVAQIEVDDEYLTRRTEIEQMRRDMMAEFARMLGDDPRLLRRYLDTVRRRQTSLRDRLMEATELQEEIADEVTAWIQVDETQRPELWKIIRDKRLQQALPLFNEAAELTNRVESTLPLSLDAEDVSASRIITTSTRITAAAQDLAISARRQLDGSSSQTNLGARSQFLFDHVNELIVSLEGLEFETPESDTEIREYLAERLVDARELSNTTGIWKQTARGLIELDYQLVAISDQSHLVQTTDGLLVDFKGLAESLEDLFGRDGLELPDEIRVMVEQLAGLIESITMNQAAIVYCLSTDAMRSAAEQLELAVKRFYDAEDLFDRIRVRTAAILDEQEVRRPNVADLREPTLDAFLERLEREPRLFQQLELGNRRTNLRVIQDWMMWQTRNGGGGTQLKQVASKARQRITQARNELGQTTERADETERLQQMLAESIETLQRRIDDSDINQQEAERLRQQLAQMREMLEDSDDQDAAARWKALVKSDRDQALLRAIASGQSLPDQQWNKLISQLEDGLWQVRGRTPPTEYREAIDQYQEIIRQVESL
ncbi:MAG: hypothetical protein AAF670_15545 [Planctomycetota bacterium]